MGAEHRVFGDDSRVAAIKVTNTGRCGMTYRFGEPEAATPVEYLQRWQLHNLVFNDTVWLEGVMESAAGICLVVGQNWITGEVPSEEQVHDFMLRLGFQATALPESYYRASDGLAALDCHQGNFIIGLDGVTYAIDVVMVVADAALKARMEVVE